MWFHCFGLAPNKEYGVINSIAVQTNTGYPRMMSKSKCVSNKIISGNDIGAWQESMDNSMAQLEHQANR